MKLFRKLSSVLVRFSYKMGLSREEYRFLSGLFLIGIVSVLVFHFWKTDRNTKIQSEFDRIDSIFNQTQLSNLTEDTISVQKTTVRPTSIIKPLNLNRAGLEELTTLPGIGEKTATNIIGYRSINGKFKSSTELLNIKGIGEKKLERIRPFLVADSLLSE
ncbi:MAG: helix-hairpin-helix domain-containing protein [Bacteroidetes bacterium]|nr:helix-hairpin-helix domain-containing protein [Bacteroidota bacterium]